MTTLLPILLLLTSSLSVSLAFTTIRSEASAASTTTSAPTATSLSSTADDHPLADLDDERKSNLFSTLLRDLQYEGVPLLGCDADQVHTLQAAIWTTMAELSVDQDDAQRACLIVENIPTAALQTFVDDFLVLKTQLDQMEFLPELERVSASVVGKGLGPALLLEVKPKMTAGAPTTPIAEEFKYSAAMKAFMNRVVVGSGNPDDPISIGLGDEGSVAPIDYRFSSSSNVCAIVASFWNCICEMQADSSIGTLCLQLPSVSSANDSPKRTDTVAQLLGRSLCLYQGDSVFSLVHFSPQYDRSIIEPVDKPAFGHLPPVGWLKPMLKANGDAAAAESLDDAVLAKSNYQRRSPIAAVNIVRNSMLADPKIVTIELDGGMGTQASGLKVYCPNTIKLAATDEAVLKAALEAEMAILE
jgi:hypothetical protein